MTSTSYSALDKSVYLIIFFLFTPKRNLGGIYSNRTVRPSAPLCVRCISPLFFDVGIPNLMCGCILGWRNVAYHFWVTVTLTSDLVNIVITLSIRPSVRPSRFVAGAYLLYSLMNKFQIWCADVSLDGRVSGTIFWSLWPWP